MSSALLFILSLSFGYTGLEAKMKVCEQMTKIEDNGVTINYSGYANLNDFKCVNLTKGK